MSGLKSIHILLITFAMSKKIQTYLVMNKLLEFTLAIFPVQKRNFLTLTHAQTITTKEVKIR